MHYLLLKEFKKVAIIEYVFVCYTYEALKINKTKGHKTVSLKEYLMFLLGSNKLYE